MYLSFFNLTGFPFSSRFDINHLFLSETHSEALSAIIYGVLERKPFVVILGEVGLGKTAILQAALARLASEPIHIINVSYPLIKPDGITALLADAALLDNAEAYTTRDLNTVDDALLAKPGGRDHIVMIIDEAQAIPSETLEFVRLVSNLRAAQAGILQFILVGQPEFWGTLSRYDFRHLRQRIAIRRVMTSLSKADAQRYIEFRLQLAGSTVKQTMTPRALKELLAAAGGVPRRINMIADNALLNGYAENVKPITHQMVREAVRALGGEYRRPQKRRPWGLIAGLAAACVLLGVAFTVAIKGGNTPSSPAPAQTAQLPATMPPALGPSAAPPTRTAVTPLEQPGPKPLAGPAAGSGATEDDLGLIPGLDAAAPPPRPPDYIAAAPTITPPASSPAASKVESVLPAQIAASTTKSEAKPSPPPAAAKAPAPAAQGMTDDLPPAAYPADQAPKPSKRAAKHLADEMRPPSTKGVSVADATLPHKGGADVNMRYKVRFGETVYELVRHFYGKLTERNVDSFLKLNPSIKSPGMILEGSYVLVPSSRPVLDEKLGDRP